jgi:hypothetical protein
MSSRVYYVYAPAWADWSAGIKVLHYFCHYLNKIGEESYLAIHGPKSRNDETNRELNTPVLDRKILKQHERENRQVIVIYPEGVSGNPLGGQVVIRWLLNYASLLGGQINFSPEEYIWAYSRNISNSYFLETGKRVPVFFIPAVNVSEVESVPDSPLIQGNYEILYAQKFRALGGKPEVQSVNKVIEITRFNSNSTTRTETLNLLKFAQAVHIFENTSIATEASLFGVPVVCHKNELFDTLIAEYELGVDGFSWFPNTGSIVDSTNAREMLQSAWSLVSENLISALGQIDIKPKNLTHRDKVRLPNRSVFSKHAFARASLLIRQKGLVVFGRFLLNYVRRIFNQV